MKNINSIEKIPFITLVLFSVFITIISSCAKDAAIEPDTPPSGGNNDTSNITQVDVNGLNQNFINAEGVSKIQLTRTLVEGYVAGSDNFTKMTYQGEGNTTITVLVKGTELQEGNFSLKKFRLGSNPSETEAVVYLAINSTLLDFEISSSDRLSIAKNAEGFYVIKMGPTVGIKRNSWDPELTAPISFHIVNNPAKIVISDNIDGASTSNLYSYTNGEHNQSNQPFTRVTLSNTPGQPIDFRLIDYDFSSGTVAKANYTLSQVKIKSSDDYNGTVPKGIHIFYGSSWNGGQYTQDYTLSQNMEIELSENYITLKYTDLVLVHTTDPTKTVKVSGDVMIAR
jgi:hypothetical protein